MAIDLTPFEGVYTVRQGGSSAPDSLPNPLGTAIETDDTLTFVKVNEDNYTITVTSKDPELVFHLTWDKFGNLGGTPVGAPPDSDRIVRVSVYAQDQEDGDPYPLKVLYGTIIKTDPDSVAAWSADDQ